MTLAIEAPKFADPLIQKLRLDSSVVIDQLLDPYGRIKACGDADRYATNFGRDTYYSVIMFYSHRANFSDLTFLKAAIATVDLLNEYEGKGYIPRREERLGRKPHEIWFKYSPQDRLGELLKGGHPVQIHSDGKMTMHNYFGGDETALANRAMKMLGYVIDHHAQRKTLPADFKYQDGDDYYKNIWKHIKAGVNHDNRIADKFGGLIATVPRNSMNFHMQTRRDGEGAYKREDGSNPEAPYMFLTNNSQYIKSLEDSAEVAERLGFNEEAQDWRRRAEKGRRLIDQNFWWSSQEIYVPMIDSKGPVEIVNSDAVDIIECGIVPDNKVSKLVRRVQEEDLFTMYGIRSRSEISTQFVDETGLIEGYQNGALWPDDTDRLIIGLARLGYTRDARLWMEARAGYNREAGFSELRLSERRTHQLKVYAEKDKDGNIIYDQFGNPKDAACKVQTWSVAGARGSTAWAISDYAA